MAASSGAGGNNASNVSPAVLEERKQKIREAFSLFDNDRNGTIVQEEVPTVMRFLGVYPSDQDLVDKILPEMQGDEPVSYVRFDKFEEKMLELMESGEYAPDSEDMLLRAFRTLDPDDTGTLDPERIKQLLMEEGDSPFREKEADAFLSFARDRASGLVHYEDYVAKMADEE